MLPQVFKDHHPLRPFLILMGLVLILFVVASMLAAGILAVGNVDLANPTATEGGRYALLGMQALISLVVFAGSSLLTLAWGMGTTLLSLNVARNFTLKQAAWVVVLLMASLPAIGTLSDLNASIDFRFLGNDLAQWMVDKENELKDLTSYLADVKTVGEFAALAVVVGVIAGFCEELFFRGLLQNMAIRWFGNPHVAIWVVAFVFGFIHFQFLTMIPRVVLGALFGYIYHWSGSLYLAMAGHFVNNFVTAVGMVVLAQSNMPIDTLDHVPLYAGAISAIVVVAGSLFFRAQLTQAPVNE